MKDKDGCRHGIIVANLDPKLYEDIDISQIELSGDLKKLCDMYGKSSNTKCCNNE